MKRGFDTRKNLHLVAYKTFADVAGKAASFAIAVLAARALTPEAFGIFALGATAGWMASLAADFGMQVHVARSAARRPDAAPALLGRWLRVRLSTAAAAAALLVLAALLTDAGGSHSAALLLFALAYLASGLLEFLYFYFRGLSRSDLESTISLGHRGLTLASAAATLWWWPGVTALATALLIPAVLALLVAIRVAQQSARDVAVPSIDRPSGDVSLAGEFARDVLPIGAGVVLAALYFRVDVLLLQAWSGTESVGLYNAVFRIVEALRLFPAAVLAVALPLLVRATSTRPLARVAAAVTVFAVAVSAILWFAAGWLIPQLYGPAYGDAVPAFRVLLLSFPLMSLNYALTHQLIGWDGHRAYALLCGAALTANVALNARLIPSLSMVGAAWATVATEAVLTLGCLAVLWMPVAVPRVNPVEPL